MSNEDFLNFRHAREPKQIQKMEAIQKAGVCPFCSNQLMQYHDAPIDHLWSHWVLTDNDFPYEGTEIHKLIILKEHATKVEEITPEAWKELGSIVNAIKEKFNLSGGALFLRFGDTNITGATIAHLHVHILTGGTSDGDPGKLKVSLGYKRKPA